MMDIPVSAKIDLELLGSLSLTPAPYTVLIEDFKSHGITDRVDLRMRLRAIAGLGVKLETHQGAEGMEISIDAWSWDKAKRLAREYWRANERQGTSIEARRFDR